jgi:S-adenosylmethionine:diacylglycerol 3-amino-3-carboxypropyl transferase
MYEDCAIEAAAFAPGGRVFCIASAGCTALALAARGDRVTAVDINPAQVDYVRARLAGDPPGAGVVDHLMARGRRVLRWLGLREPELRTFLLLDDPVEQSRYWRDRLDTITWRAMLACALNPLVLRAVYAAPFLRVLPRGFANVVRRRFERGWARHANRTNRYAWQWLLGCDPPGAALPPAPVQGLDLVCADAADYLETCNPASFDGFSLSNILDGADSIYRERLLAAVRRTAAPKATMVLRSFAEPRNHSATNQADLDRAMLWGIVRIADCRLQIAD